MPVLAHAASAEDGSGFGRPGDQTGREVRMEPLGSDGNAWVWIFRWEGDPKIPYNIAEANRQACINICVGYSRETYTGWGLYYTRYGLWEAILIYGDIRKIDVPVNCDCSQLQISACLIAGVPNANQYRHMVTAIEDQVLTALGFKRYPYRIEDVKKGDILWREGHTGCVVEGWDDEPAPIQPSVKYVGRITDLTPVYKIPKADIKQIQTLHPLLGKDNLVDVCDETEGFYYVRIIDVYGYVPTDKIVRNDEDPSIKIGDKVHFSGGEIYISANGGNPVKVPAFDAEVQAIMDNSVFKYPYYIYSKMFDGWCAEESLTRS